MANKGPRLRNYVYRTLALRVALAALLIAVILATVVFVSQRDRVADLVLETALNRISILRTQTLASLKESPNKPIDAFRQALVRLKAANQQSYLGSLSYARFYTSNGEIFAELVEPEAPDQLIYQLGASPQRFPGLQSYQQIIRIADRPYIHLVIPINNQDDQLVAYAEGIFTLSDAVVSDLRQNAIKTALWVALIVLVTAAILYPTIHSLTRRLATYSEDLLASHLETVQTLGSAIAKRDSNTSAHNFRVTLMAIRVAEEFGLTAVKIQKLIIGAFLHDVGKIGIRDEILLKPAHLDDAEYAVMKSHVNHGVEIVSGTEWLHSQQTEHVATGVELLASSSWLSTASDVVSCHHEKYDGSGYPQGLAGEDIPLEARIFAVVDVFDALSCQRPYKQPFSYEKTLQILEEGRGSHFDPKILDIFNPLTVEFYNTIAGREDEGLQQELEVAASRYFAAGLETLGYN